MYDKEGVHVCMSVCVQRVLGERGTHTRHVNTKGRQGKELECSRGDEIK